MHSPSSWLVALLLLAVVSIAATASPTVEPSSGLTIAFEGLNRTRESTVERIARVRPGMAADEVDPVQVRDRLLRSGLFAEVRVELDSELQLVSISVEERWTLIPVPFLFFTAESVRGGLALLESNLAGTGHAGLLAGIYGTDGFQIMSGFIASSVGANGPGVAVFAGGGRGETETADTANRVVERFDLERAQVSGRVTFRAAERLSPLVAVTVAHLSASPGSSPVGNAEMSATVLEPAVGVEWEDVRFVSFFNRGTTARVVYRHGFSLDGGSDLDALSVDAAWTIAIADRHRLQIDARGLASNAEGVQLERPTGAGFRVVPGGRVTANRYVATGVTAEVPVIARRWGTVTVSGFYDGGVMAGGATGDTGFHGPGGGVALYLARIALPALGVTVGYNADSGFIAASALVGFSM